MEIFKCKVFGNHNSGIDPTFLLTKKIIIVLSMSNLKMIHFLANVHNHNYESE